MSTLNRLTRTGGVLYVSTPNIVSARSLSALLSGQTPYLSSEYQRAPSPDRHNREYTPSEVVQLVEAAGFDVEWARTTSFYADPEAEAWAMKAIEQSGGRTEDRGDTIIVEARKSSGVRDRYPRFLYFDA